MMPSVVIAFIAAAALTLAQGASDLPQRFVSRSAAVKAGCRIQAVKGPTTDTCVLAETLQDPTHIVVYQSSSDGAYTVSNEMEITSQYWDAKLSFADVLGAGTHWLVVETTGMHGTGIRQRILVVTAWDGSRFRTVAAESLNYGCFRPTSAADYELLVEHTFKTTNGTKSLQLKYELTKDRQRIGEWTDNLRWDGANFIFTPSPASDNLSNPVIDRVRKEVARVREYLRAHPLDPTKGSDKWIGDSGLMDVLNPVCFK